MALNAKQIWQAALGELQLQMSRANFETWLRQAEAVSYEREAFVVRAPTTFAAEWLDRRLRPQIEQTLEHVTGQPARLDVIVGKLALPVDEMTPGSPAAIVVAPPAPSAEVSALPPPVETNGWLPNPGYTFATFVEGSGNRLAVSAARSVAATPGQSYNPLFIYGGVGLGKTHMLHAIAHVGRSQRKKILYVTSEAFTNDVVNSILQHRMDEFRARYRTIEILLIDDIQFIAGKDATQEEFFHTFNALHEVGHQIVLSSDRPPKLVNLLEERLRSRFEWGLAVDVQPPDLETRRAILRAKAVRQKIDVPDPILDFLADRVRSNIRELEGALNRVVAYSKLLNQPLTIELASGAIEDLTQSVAKRMIGPNDVIEAVCRYYKIDRQALKGKARDKDIVLPRQVAMFLMRDKTDASLLEIGRELGGRDHSTILHGCEKIEAERQANVQLRRDLAALEEMIQRALTR